MRYRLIIVDDEQEVREVLSEVIDWEALGFEVVKTLQDGRETIDYLQQAEVDVVLSDVKMAFVSGIEVARFVHERQLPVKVVLLSGFQEFQLAKEAIRYNVKEYLLKPTDLDELYRVFQAVKEELDLESREESVWMRHQHRFAAYLLFQTDAGSEEIREQFRQTAPGTGLPLGPCMLLGFSLIKSNGAPLTASDIAGSKRAMLKMLAEPLHDWLLLHDDQEHSNFHAVLLPLREQADLVWMDEDTLRQKLREALDKLAELTGLYIQIRQAERFDELESLLCAYRQSHKKASQMLGIQVESDETMTVQGANRAIRQAQLYMQQHYSSNMSLETVAKQVHLHPVYFGQLFKQHAQMTFSDYLIAVRIEQACRLLGDSNMKVYEICEQVGYKDIKHFYKLFRRQTGRTPSEYRGQQ